MCSIEMISELLLDLYEWIFFMYEGQEYGAIGPHIHGGRCSNLFFGETDLRTYVAGFA